MRIALLAIWYFDKLHSRRVGLHNFSGNRAFPNRWLGKYFESVVSNATRYSKYKTEIELCITKRTCTLCTEISREMFMVIFRQLNINSMGLLTADMNRVFVQSTWPRETNTRNLYNEIKRKKIRKGSFRKYGVGLSSLFNAEFSDTMSECVRTFFQSIIRGENESIKYLYAFVDHKNTLLFTTDFLLEARVEIPFIIHCLTTV